MKNVSDKSFRKIVNTKFIFNNAFYFQNRSVYEIIWKSILQQGKPLMKIWRTRITFWLRKATNIHPQYVINIAFPLEKWFARTCPNVTPDVYEVLNHNSVFVIFCRAVSNAQYTCSRGHVLYETRKLVQPGTCTHSSGTLTRHTAAVSTDRPLLAGQRSVCTINIYRSCGSAMLRHTVQRLAVCCLQSVKQYIVFVSIHYLLCLLSGRFGLLTVLPPLFTAFLTSDTSKHRATTHRSHTVTPVVTECSIDVCLLKVQMCPVWALNTKHYIVNIFESGDIKTTYLT